MANKYLPLFPKPILDDLVTGRWLPVIGAGMSLNAVVPGGRKMPLWGEMSKALTDELIDFAPTSILDGVSAYEHEYGRTRLIERLTEILFIKEAVPKEFCCQTELELCFNGLLQPCRRCSLSMKAF